MFRYEELKESFYSPDKCVKGFVSCQKGYDQLTHGMLQVIKLQRSIVQTKENVAEIKSVAKNFATSSKRQLTSCTLHFEGRLKKLAEFCERMSSILGNVHEADNRNLDTNFDLVKYLTWHKCSTKCGGETNITYRGNWKVNIFVCFSKSRIYRQSPIFSLVTKNIF